MKKIASLILSFTLSLNLLAQIPNNGFESWTLYHGVNTANSTYFGLRPIGWDSSDSLTQMYMGGSSVTFEPNPIFGGYSAKLTTTTITVSVFGIPVQVGGVPGVLTNGTINANLASTSPSFTIHGGSPDTSRSATLHGYYKLTQSTTVANTNDTAIVRVLKLRRPLGSTVPDTIGEGVAYLNAAYANLTGFDVNINYRDFTHQPDTTLIIITSGYLPPVPSFSNPRATTGTQLLIDSLTFSGYVPLTGIDELNPINVNLNVYPIPASSYLNVYLPDNHNLSLEVMDLYGKKMFSSLYTNRVDISFLPSGTYFLNITDENKRIMGFRKILVNNQ